MSLFKTRHKKYEYNIEMDVANEMLQNVFEAVGQAPNRIPLDKLALRKETKTKYLLIAKTISIIFFILTLLMPLCFFL
ncbi:MAG: hypothetical protein PHY47_06920 [Lachnospiraceae bacterium]|nr:hypothetical protein [Lachnospiraceae bacterium]